MDLPYRKRKPNIAQGQAGEDGDFVQLRIVRKKRRESEETRKSEWRRFIQSGDAFDVKAKRPTTATRVKDIEEVRSKLFEAVKDNDKAKVRVLLSQLKQKEPITSQLASHPETNENIWHFALSNDKKDIVHYLLDTEDDSLIMSHHEIHRSGIQGNHNALHILTEKNDVEMVKTILKKINSKEQKLEMMKTETAVDIQGQRPRCLSCLHLAAYHGQAELVEIFLQKGMDVNHLNEREDTALHWAVRRGHDEIVNILLDKGADVEVKNDKGSTALYWAVRYEHVKTVKLLLEKGKANPNTKRKLGLVAPLVVASAYGNNEIVKLLLAHPKCDVNICIPGKETPKHHAAREGYSDVLSTLLEKDALLDIEDYLGNTPLLLAAQNGHAELVYKLITHGADVFWRNHEMNDIWHYAIESEDNDLLETVLAACIEKNIDMKHRQPLCIAAGRGRCDKIDFLLKLKQDPLSCDINGNTFLHYAAMNNKHHVIEKFNTIIPIDTKNERKNTPLHIACSKGFDETIKTLLKCKAKSAAINKQHETALHVAAYSKHITAEAVRELVDYTIKMHAWESLNAKDTKGNNSLHVAGKHARPEIIWEFRFVRFKDKDYDGNTPLHKAVRPGQPECLNMMLDIFETTKRDAKINKRSKGRKETVLHLAADEGLSACVKRLIDLGADLATEDADGNTVLHRLTRAMVLNPTYIKRHIEVVDTVFNGVVRWWCFKNKDIAYPGKDNRSRYLELQKKATLNLINDVFNKEGLSVLALSFKVGASDMISRLLMMPDVTMFEITDSDKDKYVFDISRLTPRTNNALKGYCGSSKVSPLDEKDGSDREKTNGTEEARLSGLELLITQKVKARAAQILDLPPIKKIENYYTSIVEKTFMGLMFFHLIYMSIFTHVGVDMLGKLRYDESSINSSDPETLLLYIIVPIEPAIIIIYVIYALIRFAGHMRRRSKLSRERDVTYFVSGIMLLIVSGYAALIFAWIVLFSVRYEFQDCVLAAAVFIGWLLSISFTRGFRKIHYFYRMLIKMILNDGARFLFVYLFVLFAFAFALHVLFQVSSDVVQDYETVIDTLFLSFNMMIGMDELFDDTFASNMSAAGRTVTYLKVFYLLYIILSTIILLNLLIAMMNDSYSNILKEQQVTWRIDSVSLGVDIETSFPASKIFSNVSIVQGHEASTKFDTTPPSSGLDISASDRWYVNIDGAVVDEYTRRQDTGSETAADELSGRLEELESKTKQMQEKTNAKLQQINELLEKMAVHKSVIKIGDS